MRTRFATPKETDLRFVRNSGFRPDDFGHEVKAIDSLANAGVVLALVFALIVMVAL